MPLAKHPQCYSNDVLLVTDSIGVECCGGFGYKVVTKGCLEALELKGVDGSACKVLGWLQGDTMEVLEGEDQSACKVFGGLFVNLMEVLEVLDRWKLIWKLRQKESMKKAFQDMLHGLGKLIQLMHTTMVPKQVNIMKIQAGVQVTRTKELRRHLQLWKCFGRLYFVVIVIDRKIVFSTWMASGENTCDLGSFREETDKITDLHQIHEEVLLTDSEDDVAGIKQRHRDPFSDDIWNLETVLGCSQLKEDLESSMLQRRSITTWEDLMSHPDNGESSGM
nr:hypothetical protein [Tanacetum cinerariifolium]